MPKIDAMTHAQRNLQALIDWMREPDHAESFSVDEMVAWINRRPTIEAYRLKGIVDALAPAIDR